MLEFICRYVRTIYNVQYHFYSIIRQIRILTHCTDKLRWKEGGKKEEPNAWDGDRVKQHNEIIAQQKAVVKKLKEKEGLMAKTGRKRRRGGRK